MDVQMKRDLAGAAESYERIRWSDTLPCRGGCSPRRVLSGCRGGCRGALRRFSDQRKRHRNLGIVLGRLMQGVVLLLGLLVALVIVLPNFKPAQLVEVLGIGTIAIGFAFRDILQNFLAGILLLLTEPFRIGDQIQFGGFAGEVEDIQTRATFIRTYDGRRIVIPNANLFTNPVTINTALEQRRIQYDVGIGVGDDIERARHAILEAIRSVAGALSDPAPQVLVIDPPPAPSNYARVGGSNRHAARTTWSRRTRC